MKVRRAVVERRRIFDAVTIDDVPLQRAGPTQTIKILRLRLRSAVTARSRITSAGIPSLPPPLPPPPPLPDPPPEPGAGPLSIASQSEVMASSQSATTPSNSVPHRTASPTLSRLMMKSAPGPPDNPSTPVLPSIVSFPAPPVSALAFGPPTIVSAPAPPVMFSTSVRILSPSLASPSSAAPSRLALIGLVRVA
jgi:hypothetical protein